jgi:hypothetical protein
VERLVISCKSSSSQVDMGGVGVDVGTDNGVNDDDNNDDAGI